MKNLLLSFFILFTSVVFSQEDINIDVDSLYREDQMYATFSLNLVQNRPAGFSKHSLSSGLSVGFLRDMPFNKKRTWAIAAGLGYSYNNLKNNIKIDNSSNTLNYTIDNTFDKNKLVLHQLDLPIEIRWRNSTFESHKFWRIYGGFKISYLFADKSVFKSSTEDITVRNNNDLSKIKYATYLSVGNNTGNIYVQYSLSPIFKDVQLNNKKLELSSLNIGFVFYIL
ncbi:porin family protein [Flavobacterium gelidilacus]|uniref:porin family protein n=1 Tax=Flavobacterium gelidilacus TaxID=206041 RepID=UPI00047BCB18|nr:porin family protein [Flavobacterium gelidilacus]